MSVTRKSAVALCVAAAIALAAVPANAQNATQTPTQEATTDEMTRDERMAEHQTAFVEALAAELDLPVDQVTDALATVTERLRAEHDAERQATQQERLDAAVANGDLTQEQADAMAAAADAGVLGGPGGLDGPRGRHGRGGSAAPVGGTPDACTDTAS